VINEYYLREYGLHRFGRSENAWFRVGNDAVLIKGCSVSCRIDSIKRDAFIRTLK
jgi:Ni/Co efflux regulator RcnB